VNAAERAALLGPAERTHIAAAAEQGRQVLSRRAFTRAVRVLECASGGALRSDADRAAEHGLHESAGG